MSPSRPESGDLIGDGGSGGRTRTYDQAVNSRPALFENAAPNQSPNQSHDGEPFVAMEFAGCAADQASRDSAMRQTHDNLIRLYPVRLGPVEWRFYAGEEAAEKLRLAGLEDDGRGLVEWLASTPGAELLITSVVVPESARRLPDRLTADDVLRRMP